MAGLLAESDFAFTVKKTPTAMEITINHPVLQGDVLDALAGASLGLEPEEVSFDGLQLLKYKHEIKNKQYEIKECIIEDQSQADRVAVFSLLYEFVDDAQTFESYNPSWLQMNGYILTEPMSFKNYCPLSQPESQPKSQPESTHRIPEAAQKQNPKVKSGEYQLPSTDFICSWTHNKAEAFLNAILEGNTLIVRDMLNSEACILPILLRNPIFIFHAVTRGHYGITKLLLQHDADPNCLQDAETPLSIAAKYGSDSLVGLLLNHGGDVHIAISLLRNHGSNVGINRLDQISRQHAPPSSSSPAMKMQARRKVCQLRNHFRDEHAHMRGVVERALLDYAVGKDTFASTSIRHSMPALGIFSSQHWEDDFEMDTHRAWNIGFKALRGLCNKKLPCNLNETLLFLCVARSMAMVFDDEQIKEQFSDDLPRWQILYSEDTFLLQNFIQAVNRIWNIDLTRFQQPEFKDRELLAVTLQDFQNFALHLQDWVERDWNLQYLDDWSMLATQARWRERRKCFPATSSNPVHEVYSRTKHDNTLEYIASQDDNIGDPPKTVPPEQSCDMPTVLTLVLAGTIFAIVIAFWLGKYIRRFLKVKVNTYSII